MARTALYLRVSTDEQTIANQRRALETWAERAGHEIVAVDEDAGVSGSRGRDRRPGFDRMLKDATRRRFAMLAAWSVDRLGRSLQELQAAGVNLFLHQQALDTRIPSGRAMFQMLGVFSEFERAHAGLARARAEGRRLGRPRVAPSSKSASGRCAGPGSRPSPGGSAVGSAPCSGSTVSGALADRDQKLGSRPSLPDGRRERRWTDHDGEQGMRFWWVNHKQTYRQEIEGGYLWSPKVKSNGHRNPFYDSMRLVTPGDVVFSFADALIRQVGIATRPAVSCPKPAEFGQAGTNWARDGWMVPVDWQPVPRPLRPKDFIAELRPWLPGKGTPLDPESGNGFQHVYLAAVPGGMADVLLSRLGSWGTDLLRMARGTGDDDGAVRVVDDALEEAVRHDAALDETTRRAVVEARRGQGRFRLNVEAVERGCRVTGVTDPRLLRASHIKPWRSCATSEERLDGNNGLLLSPNIDHLFDRGYISFLDDGRMLLSPLMDPAQIARLGVPIEPPPNVGAFSLGQAAYLAFHRASVFLDGR
jgi:hypothetical protein